MSERKLVNKDGVEAKRGDKLVDPHGEEYVLTRWVFPHVYVKRVGGMFEQGFVPSLFDMTFGKDDRTKYRIFGKKQVEINTDPQRRCYNGCHFSSEWIWSNWFHLGTVFSEDEAKDSLVNWKKCNPKRHEYCYVEVMDDESIADTEHKLNSKENEHV